MIELQTDEHGEVKLCPATGYRIEPVAGVAVLLVLQYATSPAELETEKQHQLQTVLTPPIALELAEKLRTAAQHLLGRTPSDPLQ